MLRTNSRLLFLLLLILLFVVAPAAVLAAPNLTIAITHTGNASAGNVNFLTGSNTGVVTVIVTNNGDQPTDGTPITVSVALAGGLTFNAQTSAGTFTCSPTATGADCTSSGVFAVGGGETITFTVSAPGTTGGPFTNSVTAAGGGTAGAAASDGQSFSVVAPSIILVITGITHQGNAPNNNIFTGSANATVTVIIQNQGTINSTGQTTLLVVFGGGLTFSTVNAGLFSCTGQGTNTANCTTSVAIAPGTGDTLTFLVTAQSAPLFDQVNTAFLSGGGNGVDTKSDHYSIVSAGSATPTAGAGTFTPFPTFPPLTGVPGQPGVVGTVAPVVTPTLIPPPPTRTPLPRPANAGIAIGPISRPGVTVVVDRDGVNVRLLPALGAEVIANVNGGYSTDILARSPDNEWVQVQINGELGWIGTAVLAVVAGDLNSAPVADPRTIPYGGFENPRAGLTSVTSQVTGKLQNSGLRVRGGPSRSYPVLANAPRYTIFPLLGRSADGLWVQVNFEGTLGWVAREFVEFQQGFGTLDQLPIDGIVADAIPISEPTADNLTDTLMLMRSRLELAQPSLDAIRSIWTSIALGEVAQCSNFPARPSNFNIPNPVLAPFYATLFPLNTDFNAAMTSLRQAIDLLIDACSQAQPAQGLVGQPVVQQALDTINQADALFVSLRQRLASLLPPEGAIDNETQCLFSYQNRSQVVPRLRLGQAQVTHLSRRDFVLGFCFDGGTGQSLSLQALRVNGNAEPRLTVSSFDNPTNFIGTGAISADAISTSITPILITQTGRYIVILADLDGAPDGPLSSDIALLLTDVTSGGGGGILTIDPATGNVIIAPGSTTGAQLGSGIALTPGISGNLNLTPASP